MTTTKRPLIVWGDPPKTQHHAKTLKYIQYVHALQERPGEWACLKRSEDRKSIAIMRNGLENDAYQRLVHPHKLQLSVRRTASGDTGLWARITNGDTK